MAQNIYDRPEFFEGYSALDRSVHGHDGAPEWPTLRALLPPLAGSRVLDLGCGFGWFCRFARKAGAEHVTGIDLSEKMLGRARSLGEDPGIDYRLGDLEQVELPEAAFDLVYSSLALHYVEDAGRLFREIHGALVPGGRLVFSTEHPVFMAPTHPGWITTEDGRKVWPVDSYLMEGPRVTNWLAEGVVKYYRTIGTTVNLLIATGFRIRHVEEFGPSAAQIAARPELAEERERPMFLLVSAER